MNPNNTMLLWGNTYLLLHAQPLLGIIQYTMNTNKTCHYGDSLRRKLYMLATVWFIAPRTNSTSSACVFEIVVCQSNNSTL